MIHKKLINSKFKFVKMKQNHFYSFQKIFHHLSDEIRDMPREEVHLRLESMASAGILITYVNQLGETAFKEMSAERRASSEQTTPHRKKSNKTPKKTPKTPKEKISTKKRTPSKEEYDETSRDSTFSTTSKSDEVYSILTAAQVYIFQALHFIFLRKLHILRGSFKAIIAIYMPHMI
jgi:hypothetical protein